jgi:hypothetical protein
MSKIFLKYHPAEIIEKEPSTIFEEYRGCSICNTFLMPEFFPASDSKLCIFCHRRTKNNKNFALFTFKNVFLFLSKFGFDSKVLTKIESKQIKILMKEDCFDYVDQNMIWYVNKEELNNASKSLIDSVYENFVRLEIIDSKVWNMHMENLKGKLFSQHKNIEKFIMPKFLASNPYFDSRASKFLNRNHIFS